jgi:adenosylcobinamide-GDP ribazoletransferase
VRRALAFLTPLGGAMAPDRRTLAWFPLAGAVIGAVLGLVWWGADRLWPALLVAGVVVAADLGLTGMLHVDGLIDSADGLMAHMPAERRLEVMAEPTVGAFGVTVAIATILLRFGALAVAVPDVVLVVAVWCASRTVMALAASRLRYARTSGLASAFIDGERRPLTALYGVVLAVGLAIVAGAPAVAAVITAFAVGAGVVAFGRARLGGFTGDVLGAAGYLGETAALVVGAARW